MKSDYQEPKNLTGFGEKNNETLLCCFSHRETERWKKYDF